LGAFAIADASLSSVARGVAAVGDSGNGEQPTAIARNAAHHAARRTACSRRAVTFDGLEDIVVLLLSPYPAVYARSPRNPMVFSRRPWIFDELP